MAYRDKTRKGISKNIRRKILKLDGYICGYCKCRKRKKASRLEIDHIIPVDRYGGSNKIDNFVTACNACNGKKKSHMPGENRAPKLLWHRGKAVAKVTLRSRKTKWKKGFPRRSPKISYKK